MACEKFVIVVDESKTVESLGMGGALPVDVVPFCWKYTAEMLQGMFRRSGWVAKLRYLGNGGEEEPFVTDNSNYIVDLYFGKWGGDLRGASDAMLRLPGVVEHGMFLDMATTVFVAGSLGITVKNRQ